MKLRGYHTPIPMFIISADTLSGVTDRRAQDTPTRNTNSVEENFATWGGVPHMSVKLPMLGGGGGNIFVHIFIHKNVQITSVQVRSDR